jgi:hypothetical protein
MRLILKTKLWFSNYVVKVNKSQFRHFAKALSQEQTTVGPNQETLTGRILLYLNIENEQHRMPGQNTSKILGSVRQNTNHLGKLSTNEIINFSGALNDHELTKNERLLIVKQIDLECCLRLPHLSTVDILKMLNIYMKVFPSRIADFKFYKHSIEQLSNSLHHLAKKDLLQLMFYIGLAKKNFDSQTRMRQCIRVMDKDFIDSLSSEELCIICSATFKTSTKLIINKLLLEKIKQHIHNNLPVLNDCALFVTLVKSLRHNRYQDDNLLNTISYTIFFNKTFRHYSFPAICHILALFADYFYYDEKLFQMFTKTCLDQLSESNFVSKELHLSEQLRGKDIKRFLWIMSMFSDLKLVDHGDMKDVIIPKLIERIRHGEFERDVDSLTDIILFCWMLNYRPYELVPYVLNKRNLQFVNNSKRNLRLNLLLYVIYLEDPDLSKKLAVKPVSIPNNVFSAYQLHKRPLLNIKHHFLLYNLLCN